MKNLFATLCALCIVATPSAQVESHEIITASGKTVQIKAQTYWLGESNKKVVIISNPSEATIEIDGTMCGTTPLVVCGFKYDPSFKISKEGYREQVGSARTNSNGVGLVSITLNQNFNTKEYSYVGRSRDGMRLVRDPKTKLYGYVNDKRHEVIPCKYDKAYSFRDGVAMVTKGKLSGVINRQDEVVVPFEYYNFMFHNSEKYIFGFKHIDGKQHLNIFDQKGKRLFNNNFSRWVISSKEALVGATKVLLAGDDRVWQFDTKTGELKHIEGFDKVGSYDDYNRIYGYDGDKRGMLFRNGEVAIPASYDKLYTSKGTSVMRCFKNNKAILIDSAGHKLCEPKFDYIYAFVNGRAITKIDSLCGFITDRGVEIVEPKYRSIELFSEGRSYVKVGELWGIIDESGKMVVEPISQQSAKFSFGIGLIQESRINYYYIDIDGNRLFDRNFRDATQFTSEGIAFVEDVVSDSSYPSGNRYFIDTLGNAIDTIRYQYCHTYITPDGRTPLTMQHRYDKYIFVDRRGVPMEGNDKFYRSASKFQFDVAIVSPNPEEYYLIDTMLNRVSQNSFQYIDSFDSKSKLALAKRDNKWGMIDTKGNVASEFLYDSAFSSFGNLIRVVIGDKAGFIDNKGNVVIDVIYDYLNGYGKDLILAGVDNKYRYLDYSGKPTTDMWFDHIFRIDSDKRRVLTYRKGEFGVLDFDKGYIRDVDIRDYANFNKLGIGYLRQIRDPRHVTLIDSKGEFVNSKPYVCLDPDFESLSQLTPMSLEPTELVYIGIDGKVALRAEKGEMWYYISPFDCGIACVWYTKQQGEEPTVYRKYINEKGKEPFNFDHLDNLGKFIDGIAIVRDTQTQLYGIIDTKGKWFCEPQFVKPPHYRSFQDCGALLCVEIANNYWQINRKGELFEMDSNFVELLECGWGF